MRALRTWGHLALPIGTAVFLGGLVVVYGNPQAPGARGEHSVRMGYFPNLTHAVALAGIHRGLFQKALAPGDVLDPKGFNAGPEEMEALLAGEIDLGYVGPSPAINTYLKSGGRKIRILAGACSGGASLVARSDSGVTRISELADKRLAIPQLGGTQDVSARTFLAAEGLFPQEKGGRVQIIPAKNPDILALFKRKQIDAAWVPEPWASRLVEECNGKLVVDERDLWPGRRFAATVLVGRTAYLEKNPSRVQAILRAHLATIRWLRKHPDRGRESVNAQLKQLTGQPLGEKVIRAAWERMEFTSDPLSASIGSFVDAARRVGYVPREGPEIGEIFSREPLENARRTLALAGR